MSDEFSILIADDNLGTSRLMSLAMQGAGLRRIDIEHSPTEVAERVRRFAPDLILLNMRISLLNGHEIIARLREMDVQTPIVVYSADYTVEERRRAFHAGCSGYFPQPLTLSEYRSLARTVMEYWRGSTRHPANGCEHAHLVRLVQPQEGPEDDLALAPRHLQTAR